MGKRRGQGEGSIFQRESDGRWVASVDLGDVTGKRKRRTLYGRSRKEVAEKLKIALRDQQQGIVIAPVRLTVARFLDQWIQDIKKPSVRPKTFRSYEQNVRLYLKPELGRYQLTKLTAQMVQTMLNDLSESGLKPNTVQRALDVLKNALGHAMKWDLVPRNVALLVAPPRSVAPTIRYLDAAQAKTLLRTVRGDQFEALCTVALAMGLRQGEALGLRWQDIDFTRKTLRVEVSLQRVNGKLSLVELKTDPSRRTLNLPQVVIDALLKHRAQQQLKQRAADSQWVQTGLVFTTRKGTAMDARNVTRRFKSKLAEANLPDMRWHDLRHSCASLLLAQNVPLPILKATLGHSQIAVTMQYAHLVPELQELAATSMDSALAAAS